jgi:ribose/xylose/arabinose/galactoside ABC-type transport system permease subunit
MRASVKTATTPTDSPPVDPAAASEAVAPQPPGRKVSRRGIAASVTPAIFLVVVVVYAFWLGSSFLQLDTRMLDVHQNTPQLLVALALCVCMVAGRFDLSIGGMATMTCFLVLGLRSEQGLPFGAVIALCLLIGLVGGAVNAILVVRLNVNAFIATLATGGVLQGLSHVYSGGSPLTPSSSEPGHTMPDWFTGRGSIGSFQTKVPSILTYLTVLVLVGAVVLVVREAVAARGGRSPRWLVFGLGGVLAVLAVGGIALSDLELPWTVFILLTVASLLWTLLRYTAFGRELYAIGGNPLAARLAGVSVASRTTSAFLLSGVIAAFAGLLLAANQGSASPDIAVPYLLPAFAAVFLSTVLFSAGHFHVWGTVLGGYLLVLVAQGLIVGGVPFTWTDVVSGLVLALAVSFSRLVQRAR